MTSTTPSKDRFDDAHRSGTPPWVIGEPQPSVVELEAKGLISGKVLDAADRARYVVSLLGLAVGTRVDEPARLARA